MTVVLGNMPANDSYTPPTGGPYGEVGSAAPAPAPDTVAPSSKDESGRPFDMPSGDFAPMLMTEAFYFEESDLPSDLWLELAEDLGEVDVHQSWTDDYSAEGGPQVVEFSVEGSFSFDVPSQCHMDLTMVSDTEDVSHSPYLLELELDVGDITFEGNIGITVTVPPADLNPGCEVVFDAVVEGTLENVVVVIEIVPPHDAGSYSFNHFYMRDDVELSFTTDVDGFQMTFAMREELIGGLSWVPPFSLLGPGFATKAAADFVAGIEADLTEKFEDEMADSIHEKATSELTSTIQNDPHLSDLVDWLDGYFWGAIARNQTDMVASAEDADKVVICSTVYLAAEDRVFYSIALAPEPEPGQEWRIIDPGDPYGVGKLLYAYGLQPELPQPRDPQSILEQPLPHL